MAWIEIGWIGRPHGLQGAFLVTGDLSDRAPLRPGAQLRLRSAEDGQEVQVVEASLMPKGWKLRLNLITSPEQAKSMHGTKLFMEVVHEEQGEFFPSELEGFRARESGTERELGVFDGIEYLPAGPDRWWFRRDGGQWSVPATHHFIQRIDRSQKCIVLSHVDELVRL